jgi:uncharacterized protein YjbI with pentapeptide repeats
MFRDVKFQYKANFNHTRFKGKTDFYGTTFQEARFVHTHFEGETNFNYVVFENGEKIVFIPDTKEGLSNVSFMNTDVTRVRFDENIIWNKNLKEKFKVIGEEKLVEKKDQ